MSGARGIAVRLSVGLCLVMGLAGGAALGGPPASLTAKFETYCARGDARACNDLGLVYMYGVEGIPQDESRAATLYEKACAGRMPEGCNNLGVSYKEGRGVPKDEHRAAVLMDMACKGGHSQACARR